MKRLIAIAISAALIAALALGVSGCRRNPPAEKPAEQTSTESVEPTRSVELTEPTDADTDLVSVKLYFIRGEKIGVAAREVSKQSPAAAAVEALLEGPTAEEREFGLGTTIPEGTRLNGVTISGGKATVDLSSEYGSGGGSLSMTLRVAEVVCTLSQFPSVKTVSFKLDGKPANELGGEGVRIGPTMTLADVEGELPPILVESPAPGQTITSPVTIAGSSNVFEATHQIEITDPDGLIIAKKTVTATSGTGTRGTWKVTVPYPAVKRSGLGEIIAFEYSAKDGKRINIVEIPVRFVK